MAKLPVYPAASAGGHPPLRSLQQTLLDLQTAFRKLPLTDPNRARLAQMIVGVEDQIERANLPAKEST